MPGVRAVQFYSYLPRSESGFHFKSIFYLLPIQMATLEVTTRWGSTVKSSFPNFEGAKHLTHRALLQWWYSAAVRPSAILIDVKIREKSCTAY